MTDVDWPPIELRWKAGESPYRISKSLGGRPTRQAIEKRCKVRGWQRNGQQAQPGQLANATWLQRVGDYRPCGAKDTPEVRALVLSGIEDGMPRSLAAELSGISMDTLRRWLKADATFASQVREVERSKVCKRVGHVEKASERDWKAAKFLLETDHITREHFQPPAQKHDMQIIVSLNIPRADPNEEPIVIDN